MPMCLQRFAKRFRMLQLKRFVSKKGPLQKLDLEDGELSELVKAFALESSSHQVVIHDINDYFKELALP